MSFGQRPANTAGLPLVNQTGTGRQIGYQPGQSAPQHYPALATNISLQVERMLPVAGEVMASPGMRVEADTPIARTLVPGRPRLFNLSEYFELEPKEIAKVLVKEVNDRLPKGEVLAHKKGLGGKSFRAPFEGVFSAFDSETGYISLTPVPKPFTLEAFVRGQVAETISNYGIKLDVRASYVRGAFGFGGERHGVLRLLVNAANQPLEPDSIDQRSTFFVVLGGSTVRAETLERAVELKVRGIITGSIREEELAKFLGYRHRSSLYRIGQHVWRFPADIAANDAPLTLVVTEGFGSRPMATRVFEMLAGHNGQEVSISGATRLRRDPKRPEIILPVPPAETGLPSTSLNLSDQIPRLNSIVRLLNPSYLGVTARVVSLTSNRTRGGAASVAGQLDRTAEVEVGGHRVTVPFSDIEVLEQPR